MGRGQEEVKQYLDRERARAKRSSCVRFACSNATGVNNENARFGRVAVADGRLVIMVLLDTVEARPVACWRFATEFARNTCECATALANEGRQRMLCGDCLIMGHNRGCVEVWERILDTVLIVIAVAAALFNGRRICRL